MNIKKLFFSLYFVVFNDGIGWGIVLTIFAPMLLNTSFPMLISEVSTSHRLILIGMLFSIFGFAQFISAPLLGTISDRIGRRKVLITTLWLSAFANALTAFAIYQFSLMLLIASRFLAGLFSANLPIAQAAIGDMSSLKTRGKNLATIGIVSGTSWIIGPAIGGLLALPKLFPWFNFIFPMTFVCVLFVLNAFLVMKSFRETNKYAESRSHGIKHEITNLSVCWHKKELRYPLLAFFIYVTGRLFFIQFYPPVLVEKFESSQIHIGFYSGILALSFMFGSFLYMKILAKGERGKKIVLPTALIAGSFVIACAFYSNSHYFILSFIFAGIGSAIFWIQIMTELSSVAGARKQGMIFGVEQSLSSFCLFLSPFIAGFLSAKSITLPLITSGLFIISSGLFYYFSVVKNPKNKEVT